MPPALALAPAKDGVWYGRWVGTTKGVVGFINTAGATTEREGLPPMALSQSKDGLYVAAIVLDEHSRITKSKIERLDPGTLKRLASADFPDPTDLVATDTGVWAVNAEGALVQLRSSDLKIERTVAISGKEYTRIVFADGHLWVLNTPRSGVGHLLHIIDPALPADDHVIMLDREALLGALATDGTHVWAFLQTDAVASGRLVWLSADGAIDAEVAVRAPAGLAYLDGVLWWAAPDGNVGAVDAATRAAIVEPTVVSLDLACLTASAGKVWACGSEGLIVIQP